MYESKLEIFLNKFKTCIMLIFVSLLAVLAISLAIAAILTVAKMPPHPDSEPQVVIEVPYTPVLRSQERSQPIYSYIKGKVKRKTQSPRMAPSMTFQDGEDDVPADFNEQLHNI